MTILVSQPNTEYASQCVTIFANGESFGGLGPGESILVQTDAMPCTVQAICGFYSASITLRHDGELSLRWSINGPLELIATKAK